eukprot:RCo004977
MAFGLGAGPSRPMGTALAVGGAAVLLTACWLCRRWLTSRRKLCVVFDFDCCLMKIHMWGTFQDLPIANVPMKADFFGDMSFLQWLIPTLHENGVQLAIATFGRRAVVLKAMRFLLGENQRYFTPSNVSTPADHGCNEGWNTLGNKNVQLQALSKKFGVPLSRILFFDDDAKNVEQAKALGVDANMAAPLTRKVWAGSGRRWCEAKLGRSLTFEQK